MDIYVDSLNSSVALSRPLTPIAHEHAPAPVAQSRYFNSDTYASTLTPSSSSAVAAGSKLNTQNNNNNNRATANQSSLIDTLIERATDLKHQMMTHASDSTPSQAAGIRQLPAGGGANEWTSFVDDSPQLLLPQAVRFSNSNFNYNLNDVSRLSDPLFDADMLSALLYTNTAPATAITADNDQHHNHHSLLNEQSDEDNELNRLLNPSHLHLQPLAIEGHPAPMITAAAAYRSSRRRTSTTKAPQQQQQQQHQYYSTSNECSDAEADKAEQRSAQLRPQRNVSFEMNSSEDDERSRSRHASPARSSVSSSSAVDALSSERRALLDLVQTAKIRIEKMLLLHPQAKQQQQQHPTSVSSKSKPPKRPSSSSPHANNTSPLVYYIEYQLPVLASTRDTFTISSSSSHQRAHAEHNHKPTATQIMRAFSKLTRKEHHHQPQQQQHSRNRSNSPTKQQQQQRDVVVYDHEADFSVNLFNSNLLETWWRSTILFKVFARDTGVTPMSHYLVGTGKLSLREVFEAARFKLYKKLAVCDDTSGTRLAVLHVRVQLDSALDDFHLKLSELITPTTTSPANTQHTQQQQQQQLQLQLDEHRRQLTSDAQAALDAAKSWVRLISQN